MRLQCTSDQYIPADFPLLSDLVPGSITALELSSLHRRSAPDERWLNYVLGVLAAYRESGIEPRGFCLHLSSNIPAGAGLSSRAALETAIALTIEHRAGVRLDPHRRARLCQRAEHSHAGVPCGIMDQMAVGACQASRAMLLDCRDESVEHIPIPESLAVVVADTEVSHALGDGEYALRRQQCEQAADQLGIRSYRDLQPDDLPEALAQLDTELLRRCVRHVVTEMDRVSRMATALPAGDLEQVGHILAAGHDSLRDDFAVSWPEADVLVDAGRALGTERGYIGGRMTGGGFGGATIHLVHAGAADDLMIQLAESFREAFGRCIHPFVTRAAGGAAVELLG